jgi:hypothetical protein
MNTTKINTIISISRDGVWVGSGVVRDGIIEDCAANLGREDSDDPCGEAIYEAIEAQIATGDTEGKAYGYDWDIIDEV